MLVLAAIDRELWPVLQSSSYRFSAFLAYAAAPRQSTRPLELDCFEGNVGGVGGGGGGKRGGGWGKGGVISERRGGALMGVSERIVS